MVRKYHRFFRISIWRALNEPLSPHAIALGFAIGTFIALSPTFGFQLIPAVLLAIRLRASKIGASISVFLTNPVTIIPIYSFEMLVGDFLLEKWLTPQLGFFSQAIIDLNFEILLSLNRDTIITFLTGSFVVSCVGGLVSYFFIKSLVAGVQKTKRELKLKKQRKREKKEREEEREEKEEKNHL